MARQSRQHAHAAATPNNLARLRARYAELAVAGTDPHVIHASLRDEWLRMKADARAGVERVDEPAAPSEPLTLWDALMQGGDR